MEDKIVLQSQSPEEKTYHGSEHFAIMPYLPQGSSPYYMAPFHELGASMYFFDPWFGVVFPSDDFGPPTAEPTRVELRRLDRYVGLACAGLVLLMTAIGVCILVT